MLEAGHIPPARPESSHSTYCPRDTGSWRLVIFPSSAGIVPLNVILVERVSRSRGGSASPARPGSPHSTCIWRRDTGAGGWSSSPSSAGIVPLNPFWRRDTAISEVGQLPQLGRNRPAQRHCRRVSRTPGGWSSSPSSAGIVPLNPLSQRSSFSRLVRVPQLPPGSSPLNSFWTRETSCRDTAVSHPC